MAKRATLEGGTKLTELTDGTRPPEDIDKDRGANETNQKANELRQHMLGDIIEMREKGLFSEEDRRAWKTKLEDTRLDLEGLQRKHDELHQEEERAKAIFEAFDEAVHDAEHEGMLKRGEHEQLDQKFLETRLAERQKMLDEVKNELKDRLDKINVFNKLAEEIRDVRRRPLDAAKFYEEKEEILEAAEKMDENLKAYAKLWEGALKSGKIAKDTWDKKPDGYKYWFLSLTLDEQKNALRKAKQEDIDPRVETWEIHNSLPKEYQNSNFNRMGLTERKRMLREIEAKLDRDFGTKLREGKSVFSAKEYEFFRAEYERPQRDLKTTLSRKISFLKMIEKQTKAEKELWAEFGKFPDAVRDMFNKEFEESDFEARGKLLKERIPKVAERYNKCLQTLNDLDPHVSESVREGFDKAKTIEDKEKLVKRAEKFQKSKDRCFKKLRANSKYFQSGVETHEKIYEQKVHSLEDALSMEVDLDKMIDRRKNVHERTQKLHPMLRDRFDENQKLSDREKQLNELEDVDKAYKNGSILFLIKSGETAKKRGDVDGAFAHYFHALKLDPKNKDFQKILATLRQQGAGQNPDLISPVSREDEQNINALMARVDATPALQKEAENLAVEQLLVNLSKRNIERTGARTESTTTQRHQRTIEQVAGKDEKQVAQDLEQGDNREGRFVLDETGTYRKVVELKTSGEHSEQSKRQVEEMLAKKVHKGAAAESGLAEVRTVDASGKEVGWQAANSALQDRRAKFRKKREEKIEAQKAKVKVKKANREEEDLVDEKLEDLAA